MGYIKNWNVENIQNQIQSAVYTCSDPRLDGFSTWPIKQDLYKIKWLVDKALKTCPTYAGEEEWLKEEEKIRVVKILKNGL